MSAATQPSTAKMPTTVEIEHWVDERFPKDHRFYSRWSVTHHGESLLTFGSESEARAAAKRHGWLIRESMRGAA